MINFLSRIFPALILLPILFLMPAKSEASELYIFSFCEVPTLYIGVLNGHTLAATPFDIAQNSATRKFFLQVARELPIEDGNPVAHWIHFDKLTDHECGVNA